MIAGPLVLGVSFGYLLLLFAIAAFADRRAARGGSVIDNAWIYALSLAVYCTAWTYFGSVGAGGGLRGLVPADLPRADAGDAAGRIVVRKMIRIAQTYRITSIADFIASRYGKSPLLAALVTLITVVGIVPYIALQLKAVSARLSRAHRRPGVARGTGDRLVAGRHAPASRWRWRRSPSCSARGTSTAPSGTRAWSRPSPSSRWSSSSPSSRWAPS